MSSNRVKTRELRSGEVVAYSESAIRHNASAVEYCRTSMAALSGSTAGQLIIFRGAIIHLLIISTKIMHRYYGLDRHSGLSVLRRFGARPVAAVAAQVWCQLAKVLYQS